MPIDRQTNCILELVSTLVHCWKSTATLKVMNLIKIGLPATLINMQAETVWSPLPRDPTTSATRCQQHVVAFPLLMNSE